MVNVFSKSKVFVVMGGVFLLAGCVSVPAGEGLSVAGGEGLDYTVLAESSISGVDVVFVEMMVPHHEQALVLAELAFEFSENSDVLRFAKEIREAQALEVDLMRSWYENSDVVPSLQDHSEMAGMLSDEQLEILGGLRGREFDVAWLEGMIEHHEGAIGMSGMIRFSNTAAVVEFVEHLKVVQQREIDEMVVLLDELNVG